MATMTKVAAAAVLALTLATGARADDAPQSAAVAGKVLMSKDCAPDYPSAALRKGPQGTTTLAFQVDATSKVTGVDVVQASGPTREHRLLDAAAAAALSRCPFVPAKDDQGKPVASVITVYYTWRLD